jgi:hypothetical protein
VQKVRIGRTWWYGLGSDVDWMGYGGTWARRGEEDPDLWYVLRYEPPESGCGAEIRMHEVRESELLENKGLRDYCDYPEDGRDEYGEKLSYLTSVCWLIDGHFGYNSADTCVQRGFIPGDEPSEAAVVYLRATGARYLMGEFIGHPHKHGFTWL